MTDLTALQEELIQNMSEAEKREYQSRLDKAIENTIRNTADTITKESYYSEQGKLMKRYFNQLSKTKSTNDKKRLSADYQRQGLDMGKFDVEKAYSDYQKGVGMFTRGEEDDED